MVRACAAMMTLLLTSSFALAQDRQRGPVFRGGVEVIEVDVTVTDGAGRPITDMLGPEFTVTVGGKPRRVVTAQFITMRPERTTRAEAAAKPEVLVSSNVSAVRGRLIVIAVDRENISFGEGRHVVRAAGRFLDTLGPDDKVAFVTVPMPGPMVDFTANHQLVRKVLDGMVGVSHRPERRFNIGVYEAFALTNHSDTLVEESALVRLCGRLRPGTLEFVSCELDVRGQATSIVSEIRVRVQQSTDALEAILEGLREVDGPKSVVWISEGLVIEGAGQELAALERLSAAARATINVIMIDEALGEISEQYQSPTLKQDRELEVRGLELMAGFTRGALYRVSTNPDAVFRRMEEELSGYYLLAVEAEQTDRNGNRHPIKVTVKRRGANVRARRDFQVVTEEVANKESTEARLMRALRSPFAVADLPLRLATYAYHDPIASKVRVLLAAEIEHTTKESSVVTLGYKLTDRDGKVAMTGTQRVLLTPVEGARGPLLEHSTSFAIDPGSYTLKLAAAVENDGRWGSVEHPLQAWQMSGVPFAVSDLLLADSPRKPGEVVRAPVEARLATGSLAAYLEMYADQPDFFATTQVRVEVAANESSPALASGVGENTTLRDPKTRSIATMVPLGALPPGQYVARAIVTRGGEKIGQLSRPFHITPAAAIARIAPPATDGSRPSSVSAASALRTMLPPVAAFERADLLKSEVLNAFMDALDKGRPALKTTTALVRTGKLEGAALQALEGGDQVAAAFLRGLELFSKGDLNQAATQFTAALRIAPDFAPASFYLGACYAAAGRDKDAATSWRRALVGPDKPPLAYAALSDALFRMDDAQQAIGPLREAVAKWPDDDQLRRRLALAYGMTLQHKDTLSILEPYLTRHPTDHEALLIAVHAIYASVVSGQPVLGANEDRDRMAKYARAYAAAKGPHAALVSAWAGFVGESGGKVEK